MRPLPALALLRLLCLFLHGFVEGVANPPTALFVFGDSYADTGNHDKYNPILFAPWRPPYGNTWPGTPDGRFSDGKISTDFIASFLNISSPVPFRDRAYNLCKITSGINFAYGGSGVFNTFGPEFPTIRQQIREFELILAAGLYARGFLASSLAVVVVAGNDYTAYLEKHPDRQGIFTFVPKVVDQIAASARKLYKLGFRRIAVSNIGPTGCLPGNTVAKNFSSCDPSSETLGTVHNTLLSRRITKLKRLPALDLITLDLHSAFLSAIPKFGSRALQPCCLGTAANADCGSVDAGGKPLYSVCADPGAAFFWDNVHPTQAGWKAVSEAFRSALVFNS